MTSPLQQKDLLTMLRKPSPPSDTEARSVRNVIQGVEEQEAQVKQEISFLQQKLEDILALKRTHSAVFAPIRRLPDEILSLIFENCLSDHYFRDWPGRSGAARPPLVFTQICKHWYDVVTSTPRMWNDIHMIFRGDDTALKYEALRLWLQRAGSCPLRIDIHMLGTNCGFGEFLEQHDPDTIAKVFDDLNQRSNQWVNLDFIIPSCYFPLLQPAKGHMQSLESIKLMWADEPDDPSIMIDAFSVAPKLWDVSLFQESSHFSLPWDTIADCKLCMSPQGALRALQKLTALRHCTLEDCGDSDRPAEPATSNVLSLNITDATDLFDLLSNLTLPNLMTFLAATTEPDDWPSAAFVGMAQRSGFSRNLTQFSLRTANGLHPSDFIACLECLPHLVELEVAYVEYEHNGKQFSTFNQIVVDNFTDHHSDIFAEVPLCPRLLTLRLFGPMNFDDASFVKMVESRLSSQSQQVNGIGNIDLRYYRQWDAQALGRLNLLVLEGYLDLSCKFVPEDSPSRQYVSWSLWD